MPDRAFGVVAFAHASGSGRHSPRNRAVAAVLYEARLATLLLDLLTEEEEQEDRVTGALRFDIGLLAQRMIATIGVYGSISAYEGWRLASSAPAPAPPRCSWPQQPGQTMLRPSFPAGPSRPRRRRAWSVRAATLLIVGGDDV